MVSSLITCARTSFFNAGEISKICNSIPRYQELSSLVKAIIYPLQNAGLGLYGAKELIFDRVKKPEKSNSLMKEQAGKLKLFVAKFLHKREFEKIPFGFHPMHGGCYLSSGICGLTSSLKFLGNAACATLGAAANGLFTMANIISLEYNVTLYEEAGNIDLKNAPVYICEAVKRIKTSAVMGIINSLSYIMVSIIAIFGAHLALTILLTGIAIVTGCIKVLYDYFYLS